MKYFVFLWVLLSGLSAQAVPLRTICAVFAVNAAEKLGFDDPLRRLARQPYFESLAASGTRRGPEQNRALFQLMVDQAALLGIRLRYDWMGEPGHPLFHMRDEELFRLRDHYRELPLIGDLDKRAIAEAERMLTDRVRRNLQPNWLQQTLPQTAATKLAELKTATASTAQLKDLEEKGKNALVKFFQESPSSAHFRALTEGPLTPEMKDLVEDLYYPSLIRKYDPQVGFRNLDSLRSAQSLRDEYFRKLFQRSTRLESNLRGQVEWLARRSQDLRPHSRRDIWELSTADMVNSVFHNGRGAGDAELRLHDEIATLRKLRQVAPASISSELAEDLSKSLHSEYYLMQFLKDFANSDLLRATRQDFDSTNRLRLTNAASIIELHLRPTPDGRFAFEPSPELTETLRQAILRPARPN